MTELEVVNEMLGTLGETPLNELDPTHPYVSIGRDLLAQKNKEIQMNDGAGWWFNKVYGVVLLQDVNGKVPVDSSYMDIIPVDADQNYSVEDGFLRDNNANTDVIGMDIIADVIRLIPFEKLSPLAADAVSYDAIETFQRNYEGDMQKTQLIIRDTNEALTSLKTQQIRKVRANTQRNPQVAAAMSRFRSRTRFVYP